MNITKIKIPQYVSNFSIAQKENMVKVYTRCSINSGKVEKKIRQLLKRLFGFTEIALRPGKKTQLLKENMYIKNMKLNYLGLAAF